MSPTPITLFLMSLMTPAAAWAEAAPSELSSVVVTAQPDLRPDLSKSKLPRDLQDDPQSAAVLDMGLLQSQGVSSLADALHNVPGITLGAAEGGQIGNNINLNGFTARTDIFLDGFRDRGQYYRDTFALDAVEVLMGPSSMQFGRGSTGGAVNQVRKSPKLKPITEATLSDTTNGLARFTADIDRPLSDTAAVRLALMGQSGAATTRTALKTQDYGLAPSLRLGVGQPTELTVSALIQHNHDQPDYGLPPLNGAPAKVDRDAVYGFSDDRTIQDVAALSARLKRDLAPGLTLRDQVQYNRVDTDARETAANTIGTVTASGFKALTPSATSALPLDQLSARLQSHDRRIHDSSIFNQIELAGAAKTGAVSHDVVAGAEVGRDRYFSQAFYRNGTCNGVALAAATATSGYVACAALASPGLPASPANAPSRPGNQAQGVAETTAAYLNDTLTLSEHFKLVGGVRYDLYDATVSNSLNATNTVGSTTLARAHQRVDFTSVRGGVIWKPDAAQSYYLSYSTAFNPSLEQLTSTTGLSQPLPPETNVAEEVGAKWSLWRERLAMTAAAFQITQDNARAQNSDGTYLATGRVQVKGVRLGATGQLSDRWRLYASYAQLDARIARAIAAGTEGRVPANTPKASASLWSTYDVDAQWEVGGGGAFVSSRFANNTNLVRVPAYIRWDAMLAYHQPRYDLRLNLFNLTDERYFDALISSDGGRAVPGTGRTAMLSLTLKL